MQIETYEVTECGTSGPEIEAEALELIEKLGLDGQRKLIHRPGEGEAQRVPYAEATAEEIVVYGTLYPDKLPVTSYDRGPIPVRVLQVVAYAQEMFGRLEVWCPRARDPDPVLVAHEGASVYQPGKAYILARWGDALAPFTELRERAKVMLRESVVAAAQAKIAEAQAILAAPDAQVLAKLEGRFTGF